MRAGEKILVPRRDVTFNKNAIMPNLSTLLCDVDKLLWRALGPLTS